MSESVAPMTELTQPTFSKSGKLTQDGSCFCTSRQCRLSDHIGRREGYVCVTRLCRTQHLGRGMQGHVRMETNGARECHAALRKRSAHRWLRSWPPHRPQDAPQGLCVQVLGAIDGGPCALPVHVPLQPQVHLCLKDSKLILNSCHQLRVLH